MSMILNVFIIRFLHKKSYNITQRYVYNIRHPAPKYNRYTFDFLSCKSMNLELDFSYRLYSIQLQFTTCGSLYSIHVFGGQSG